MIPDNFSIVRNKLFYGAKILRWSKFIYVAYRNITEEGIKASEDDSRSSEDLRTYWNDNKYFSSFSLITLNALYIQVVFKVSHEIK